ncbi:hypothetical protein [Dyadobacter psychrotolerans]|jgi:hypothetical protein|uniref:Uncharacterized protein n=1 Tax=Dyadobacter psychrotolerans TaxID=2541721 RepID=A0A4R5DAC4_9BACT|nr:hypothetical protein [Dyadobacter psychrotolerans]TDE09777.1 hypothetical protein E0F88_29750 [Dyadobacter psychrotolerans]
MSNIDELDFNKLIAGLPEEEQKKIKIKLLRFLRELYASLETESPAIKNELQLEDIATKAQKDLSEVLKGIREDIGWTVYGASRKAKIRPEQVSSIEGDPRVNNNYTSKFLFRYLAALGVRLTVVDVLPTNNENI